MNRGRARFGRQERSAIVGHAQQSPDEDKGMRIMCYLLCALSVAILVGLLLYVMLP
ncbi:MAG: hypothetical protein WCA20_33510 [Candidatus Sulfotelmatobacter sp.]